MPHGMELSPENWLPFTPGCLGIPLGVATALGDSEWALCVSTTACCCMPGPLHGSQPVLTPWLLSDSMLHASFILKRQSTSGRPCQSALPTHSSPRIGLTS